MNGEILSTAVLARIFYTCTILVVVVAGQLVHGEEHNDGRTQITTTTTCATRDACESGEFKSGINESVTDCLDHVPKLSTPNLCTSSRLYNEWEIYVVYGLGFLESVLVGVLVHQLRQLRHQ